MCLNFEPVEACRTAMTRTPELKWAQRRGRVYVTWEMMDTRAVRVSFTGCSLSLEGDALGAHYALQEALGAAIDASQSTWTRSDRCVFLSLCKAEGGWWDTLFSMNAHKAHVKVDFARWCDEEDPAYAGAPSTAPRGSLSDSASEEAWEESSDESADDASDESAGFLGDDAERDDGAAQPAA